jgi:hypothetical protein
MALDKKKGYQFPKAAVAAQRGIWGSGRISQSINRSLHLLLH